MYTISNQKENRIGHKSLFINGRCRLATSTSIAFIDPSHFVTGHLVGATLSVYEFNYNDKTHHVISECDTTYLSKLSDNDLLDYRNNMIVTSNITFGTQSIYKLDSNYQITHYKDITTTAGGMCHGVRFYNDDIICVTDIRTRYIYFIDIAADSVIMKININDSMPQPKDILFVNNRLLVLYTTCVVSGRESLKIKAPRSTVFVFDVDTLNKKYEEISRFQIPGDSQADCMAYYNNYLYCCNQLNDSINIISIDTTTFEMNYVKSVPGYAMPHGVDIEPINGILGVTNYSDSSIRITRALL